ncbi:hypothetical protein VP01_3526g1 [Puccinia sorghi]|uniref:Integrase catalytic domain-containing protein n=1 Tax=Puccinia sorghi TaxID=27349 RepID=A0A0L6UVH4_9BASI|nr:hypothetical protein VP01_3526g1 [Puccinia sorghi]
MQLREIALNTPDQRSIQNTGRQFFGLSCGISSQKEKQDNRVLIKLLETEKKTSSLVSFLDQNHNQRLISEPYHPEHNGRAERANRTITKSMQATFHASGIPKNFCNEVQFFLKMNRMINVKCQEDMLVGFNVFLQSYRISLRSEKNLPDTNNTQELWIGEIHKDQEIMTPQTRNQKNSERKIQNQNSILEDYHLKRSDIYQKTWSRSLETQGLTLHQSIQSNQRHRLKGEIFSYRKSINSHNDTALHSSHQNLSITQFQFSHAPLTEDHQQTGTKHWNLCLNQLDFTNQIVIPASRKLKKKKSNSSCHKPNKILGMKFERIGNKILLSHPQHIRNSLEELGMAQNSLLRLENLISLDPATHYIDNSKLNEHLMMTDSEFKVKCINSHYINNKGFYNKLKKFGSNPKTCHIDLKTKGIQQEIKHKNIKIILIQTYASMKEASHSPIHNITKTFNPIFSAPQSNGGNKSVSVSLNNLGKYLGN